MSSSARRAGVGTRPYVLLQGRPFWSAAILRGRRPAIRRGALPHFRGPRRSPAATAAGSVGKGAAAEGVSFAACGEAKDLELAATLSRCAPSATGNCSLLRRKYRWTAPVRDARLPSASGWSPGRSCGPALTLAAVHPGCSQRLTASILPHFRAKRKRGDSPRSFRAIYFASAVASTLPNSWPL